MNKIILSGRLTKDVELGTTSNGITMSRFTIAVPRQFSKDDVDFIDIIAWRKTAEICSEHLHKGDKVGLIGRLEVEQYETAEGSKRKVWHVVADEVEFLSEKVTQPEKQQKKDPDLVPIDDDDTLPF